MSREYSSYYRSRISDIGVSSQNREADRRVLDLNDQIKELEEKVKEQKEKMNKMKLAKEDVEKAIKQEKAEFKLINENITAEVDLLTLQLSETNEELGKVQNNIQKKDNELEELKILSDEANTGIQNTKAAIQKAELALKQNERSMDNSEKMLSKTEASYEKLNQKLIQTDDDLNSTQVNIEETKQELALAEKFFASRVKVIEDEIYEEVAMREMLTKAKNELEEENKTLLTYFMSYNDLDETTKPRLHTYEFDYLNSFKDSLYNELETLKTVDETKKNHNRTLQNLQDSLKDHLSMMPLELKEDLSFELQDLMKFLTLAGVRTKEKLFIFTTLVENRVDPGIVRELANVASEMTEENIHFMETPEPLVVLALKEASARKEDMRAFRNTLLYSLAILRARKTRRDVEYSKIVILEGGEYDE